MLLRFLHKMDLWQKKTSLFKFLDTKTAKYYYLWFEIRQIFDRWAVAIGPKFALSEKHFYNNSNFFVQLISVDLRRR